MRGEEWEDKGRSNGKRGRKGGGGAGRRGGGDRLSRRRGGGGGGGEGQCQGQLITRFILMCVSSL